MYNHLSLSFIPAVLSAVTCIYSFHQWHFIQLIAKLCLHLNNVVLYQIAPYMILVKMSSFLAKDVFACDNNCLTFMPVFPTEFLFIDVINHSEGLLIYQPPDKPVTFH